MKFIFPQNYNFNNKLFGIFDYSTIFINIIWGFIIFIFTKFFNYIYIKLLLFFIFTFPVLLFSLAGFNGESLIYVLSYIFKYLLHQKVFLFQKNTFY